MIHQHATVINYDRIKLCEESTSIIEHSNSFNRLKQPINSTIGYSQALNQFRISRYEHSIHAAKQAHLLSNANLTPYELKCLEVALLLHDLGHTLGSHSIDKLYYSMADSPQLTKFGYSEYDYHEYHTVEILQTEEFKSIFKDAQLLSDVLAILSYDDKRPFSEKCPGFTEPSLSGAQIKMIYELKEWLDRVSYLELEYLVSKSTSEIINSAINQLNQFRQAIEIYHGQVVIRGGYHAQNVIILREALYAETVYHPLAYAYDEYIKRNISDSCHTYAELKSAAAYSTETLFTPELYDVLTQKSHWCLSEQLVPLITIDHYFLTDIGLNAFSEYSSNKYKCLTRSVLKRPFSASFGELIVNLCANSHSEHDIYTIHLSRQTKDFNYLTIDGQTINQHRKRVNAVQTTSVIIAVRCSETQAEVDILKQKLEREFVTRQWVRADLKFSAIYDRNIFKSRAGSILRRDYTR